MSYVGMHRRLTFSRFVWAAVKMAAIIGLMAVVALAGLGLAALSILGGM